MVTVRMTSAEQTTSREVFVMKMTPELAARLKHKSHAFVRLPKVLDVGSRLLLREFNGAPTGRADVCEILSYSDHGLAYVRRGWCWHRDAPEDLAALSLVLSGEAFPVRLEAEAVAA